VLIFPFYQKVCTTMRFKLISFCISNRTTFSNIPLLGTNRSVDCCEKSSYWFIIDKKEKDSTAWTMEDALSLEAFNFLWMEHRQKNNTTCFLFVALFHETDKLLLVQWEYLLHVYTLCVHRKSVPHCQFFIMCYI